MMKLMARSFRRLKRLAHFMLPDNDRLRRWYNSDDVLNAAYMRLHRAILAVKPTSPRSFMNLAATQIRRELLDLARHEFGPEGPGAHHASAPISRLDLNPKGQKGKARPAGDQEPRKKPARAAQPNPSGPATQARWNDLLQHIQESLSEEDRELFDLLFTQDLKQEEAAKIIGVSVPTIKRRWREIRLQLHKLTHLDLTQH
jgi:RNA polymerase sigma-70 factor (ECF subfamily)